MIRKRWVSRPLPNQELLSQLEEGIQLKGQEGSNRILLQLMGQRGITCLEDAMSFFVPSLDQLHDPFMMKDMDKAVQRLHKAIEANEHILVYGDYDVDGTTSVALVYSFLKKLHSNLSYYIPDRFKEGYGISIKGIDEAAEKGCSLIVALDCGIKSLEHVEYAKGKNIDFIICDHHTPGDSIPEAVAVLNPKRKDCNYPYNELSGCGIGFKLVQAYAKAYNINWDPEEYLDLVATSISSDIVDMTGENRILTFYGLKRINKSPRPGIKALIGLSKVNNNLTVTDLVFRIGPRINAAGRIASGSTAVKMLVEECEEAAVKIASVIQKTNETRQNVDQSITLQALTMIEELKLNDRKTTVLFNKEWHKGVIGIVASRLIDKYYRPTILLTESQGYAVGSARSVPGFDLYGAISECDDLLIQWGGHQAAAGLTMEIDKIEAFKEKFEQSVANSISEELLTPVVEYDLEIPLNVINDTFCKSIERFGPFGPENMKPVFVSKAISEIKTRVLKNNHLQLQVETDEGKTFKGIAFGLGHMHDEICNSKRLDICYTLEFNTFRDTTSVQLNVKDIQTA